MNKVSEMLALGDQPDRIAEKLGVPEETEDFKKGIEQKDFKKLNDDIEKIQEFLDLEKEIEQVESGKYALSFMGRGFRDSKLKKLQDKRKKYGSLIEAPRWFYKQPRVRLLCSIRDYALDCAEQGDAEWIDTESRPVSYPLVEMFEGGSQSVAKNVVAELSKPYGDISPDFVLKQLEGHRALYFDFEKSLVVFYGSIRGAADEDSLASIA